MIPWRIGMCKAWCSNGYCRNGDNCRYEHPRLPRRPRDNRNNQQHHRGRNDHHPRRVRRQIDVGIPHCNAFRARNFCSNLQRCRFFHEGLDCEYLARTGNCTNHRCTMKHRKPLEQEPRYAANPPRYKNQRNVKMGRGDFSLRISKSVSPPPPAVMKSVDPRDRWSRSDKRKSPAAERDYETEENERYKKRRKKGSKSTSGRKRVEEERESESEERSSKHKRRGRKESERHHHHQTSSSPERNQKIDSRSSDRSLSPDHNVTAEMSPRKNMKKRSDMTTSDENMEFSPTSGSLTHSSKKSKKESSGKRSKSSKSRQKSRESQEKSSSSKRSGSDKRIMSDEMSPLSPQENDSPSHDKETETTREQSETQNFKNDLSKGDEFEDSMNLHGQQQQQRQQEGHRSSKSRSKEHQLEKHDTNDWEESNEQQGYSSSKGQMFNKMDDDELSQQSVPKGQQDDDMGYPEEKPPDLTGLCISQSLAGEKLFRMAQRLGAIQGSPISIHSEIDMIGLKQSNEFKSAISQLQELSKFNITC